ncbi:MAG: class I SAM-dependent methyltransferase [Clostridiales bacterium]|nr:class I SAM-dependent methyltransferase [Clostridiales bacterium]
MDGKNLFTGRADDYVKSRPTYAPQLITALYDTFGFSADSLVADVGSGTGKFAGQLLEKGTAVICVEPNDDMRRMARKVLAAYSRCRFTDGDAADTKIPPGSVDFVAAAQSFHWFDAAQFKRECARILTPQGKVLLIGNHRDPQQALNRESRLLYAEHCPGFYGFSGGQPLEEAASAFFGGGYEKLVCENPLRYDKAAFISRSLSSSYSLKDGEPGYEAYIQALSLLFDRHAKRGMLEMKNRTEAYIGRI